MLSDLLASASSSVNIGARVVCMRSGFCVHEWAVMKALTFDAPMGIASKSVILIIVARNFGMPRPESGSIAGSDRDPKKKVGFTRSAIKQDLRQRKKYTSTRKFPYFFP